MRTQKRLSFLLIIVLGLFVFMLAACNNKTKNNEYSITYNGVEDAINPNTITTYKESDTIKLQPAIKEGYDFKGWSNGEDNIEEIKNSKGDITLTALWDLHEYSIYYANVDGIDNPNKTTYTILDEDITLEDVYKEGYNFDGWIYNGNKITKVDTSIAQDITLVADFGDHYCHIELEWDLSEENRFYFINEPFTTSFYLLGKNIKVAPRVYLVFGEKYEKIEVPYISGNYLTVSGFDTKTAGIKHVTFDVHGILNSNTGEIYNASTTYDIEVKDYDHDFYGYEIEPEDVTVTCPEGYELKAKAKNDHLVANYNWMTSHEYDDHADHCHEQTYKPYECYKGSSAFTNTLVVPNTNYDYKEETYKLLTIYEDMTRVYTKDIFVTTNDSPIDRDNSMKIGEYTFYMGDEFNLAEHHIGTGTISFNKLADPDPDDGYDIVKFIFDNVNYSDSFIADGLRTSPGIEYFFTSEVNTHFIIEVIGNNTLINTYYYQGAAGVNLNFQYLGTEENYSDLTITGPGSLNFIGGTPSLYVNLPLIIDTELSFTSYLGRMCNGINANAIKLTENAYVRGTNSGTGMLAMRGNILIDEGARVDLRLSMPRIQGTVANLNAIQAALDIYIYKASVLITAKANPEIFERYEGIDSCVLINAGGTITLDDAEVDLHVLASNCPNTIPVFDTAVAINGSVLFIEDSYLSIDIQGDLFNSCYGMYGGGIEIDNSKININQRCITGLNGIYCYGGNTTIVDSIINVYGRRSFVSDGLIFGLFINRNFEFTNSKITIDYNGGIAIATYMGRKDHPAYYDEDYEVIRLSNITLDDNQGYGEISVMAYDEEGMFDTFETIYDTSTNQPVTYIEVDNRE